MNKPIIFDVDELTNRLVLTGFSIEDARLMIQIEEDYMVELGLMPHRSNAEGKE